MNNKWISVWGNAISIVDNKPESYAKNITLRYPILMPMDGSAVRLTFDNFTGTEAVTLNKVTVAKTENGQDLLADTVKTVTFNGSESLTLEPRENQVSDEIMIEVKKGEQLAVSFYLEDYTLMRSGVMTSGPLSKAYYALEDQSEALEFPRALSKEITWFYFLSQVDVLTDAQGRSIICYGDSITSQAWPEMLQLKLMEENQPVGVVRRAVSGSRVLRQYNCVMYESYGIQGDVRFAHEAHACGADTVIILQGINDFIHPVGEEENQFRPWSDLPTPEELIEGLRGFIRQAKKDQMKVIVGTLLPIKGWRTYADFRNELRLAVNQWIRTTDEIDAFIDFDVITRQPNDPSMLIGEYDSGDHLHPSLAGYKVMMEAAYEVLNSME